jgi:hypothetical protein
MNEVTATVSAIGTVTSVNLVDEKELRVDHSHFQPLNARRGAPVVTGGSA